MNASTPISVKVFRYSVWSRTRADGWTVWLVKQHNGFLCIPRLYEDLRNVGHSRIRAVVTLSLAPLLILFVPFILLVYIAKVLCGGGWGISDPAFEGADEKSAVAWCHSDAEERNIKILKRGAGKIVSKTPPFFVDTSGPLLTHGEGQAPKAQGAQP